MTTTIYYSQSFFVPAALPHAENEESSDIFGDSITETQEGLVLRSNCGATVFREFTPVEGGWEVRGNAEYDGATCAINAVWGVEFPPCEFGAVESSWGYFPTMAEYELERARRRAIKGADAATVAGVDALRRVRWAVKCAVRDCVITADGGPIRAALSDLAAAIGASAAPCTEEDIEAIIVALGFAGNGGEA
jgi:hypothetical protein